MVIVKRSTVELPSDRLAEFEAVALWTCADGRLAFDKRDERYRVLVDPPPRVLPQKSAEPLPVPQKSRGVGDTIAKITSAVGIKPCGGCKQRQAALNKLLPYG